MPLLLLDLDNTLVDRDASFRKAAAEFLAEHALPEADLDWLMRLDASGYTPRQDVARAMSERYDGSLPESAVHQLLDRGAAERVILPEATREALGTAVADGWVCAVVTNGRVAQQETKIRNTGLDRLVHGWVISEAVGHKKPAPEIFHAAAASVGAALDGAWMIGDAPHADIRGAQGIGARSVWVSGGRPWTETTYRPTHIAQDAAAAIAHVVTHVGTPVTTYDIRTDYWK
ncbi:hydrolase [Streptomyces sp. SA15]|uniref:HAD family hydrolase n=1 Tax=Streptomyces sp. SA15 TaxID=934019 RepID=UPI000BAE6DC1|nr:HAD family hydrolase [Streptomyces sp. SA15]PAZ13439.1 hydrolase [Streptomyces sp. SA15]